MAPLVVVQASHTAKWAATAQGPRKPDVDGDECRLRQQALVRATGEFAIGKPQLCTTAALPRDGTWFLLFIHAHTNTYTHTQSA